MNLVKAGSNILFYDAFKIGSRHLHVYIASTILLFKLAVRFADERSL